jgi:hypothetical protein
MIYYGSTFTGFCYKDTAVTTQWDWDLDGTIEWDSYYVLGKDGFNFTIPGGSTFGMDDAGTIAYLGYNFTVGLTGLFAAAVGGTYSVLCDGAVTMHSEADVNLIASDAIHVTAPLMTLHDTYISPLTDAGATDPVLLVAASHDITSDYNGCIWLLNHAVLLTSNVLWDSNTNRWMPIDAGVDASIVEVSAFGIGKHTTLLGTTNFMNGWVLGGWASRKYENSLETDLGAEDCVRACDTLYGTKFYERVHISHQTQINQSGSATIDFIGRVPVNYRNYRVSAPTAHLTTPTAHTFPGSPVPWSYTHVDGWGGYVTIYYEGITDTNYGIFLSYINFYD